MWGCGRVHASMQQQQRRKRRGRTRRRRRTGRTGRRRRTRDIDATKEIDMKMMSHKSPLLALLFLSLFSLLPLTHGHGGPMKNSYMPDAEKSQHFMAEWITYEVDEILWVNFTVKVIYNGMLLFSFLLLYSLHLFASNFFMNATYNELFITSYCSLTLKYGPYLLYPSLSLSSLTFLLLSSLF